MADHPHKEPDRPENKVPDGSAGHDGRGLSETVKRLYGTAQEAASKVKENAYKAGAGMMAVAVVNAGVLSDSGLYKGHDGSRVGPEKDSSAQVYRMGKDQSSQAVPKESDWRPPSREPDIPDPPDDSTPGDDDPSGDKPEEDPEGKRRLGG